MPSAKRAQPRRRTARHKHLLGRKRISRAALAVASRLREEGYDGLLVGGCVRDLLLGRAPKDFDVVTNATPEEAVRMFRRAPKFHARKIGRRFRLVMVRTGGGTVEVSTYRKGGDQRRLAADGSGRILEDNVYGSREQDALRRDFTVNALYFDPAAGEVIDDVNGVEDVERRVLRCIGEPAVRYREDPVRMLRAIRFAALLDLNMEADTARPIHALGGLLDSIPPPRRFDEMVKMMHSGGAARIMKRLREYPLFDSLLPLTSRCMRSRPGGFAARVVPAAMQNTDLRIRQGKPVIAAFLFVVLLWEPLQLALGKSRGRGGASRFEHAADQVLAEQAGFTALSRHVCKRVKDIWALQKTLEHPPAAAAAVAVIAQPYFRAAYDFLLLRAGAERELRAAADFWTEAQEAAPAAVVAPPGRRFRSRRRRRRG
ncbi:MAG: polynucleotide adenylyltransferase PcnB [Gammaproteobacteria bacterium]|nr:polynucleotide adenylyltransferase PcnB [Gammaproteobacteria bacterium]MDD9850210.1 polynucleotide adenylyltransferase PcnB [Gammaproteobacteria bacterium]MDD9871847.1 polynucleotide adenylyltransferase PcnB [Gammaproteobacteria bacterium]